MGRQLANQFDDDHGGGSYDAESRKHRLKPLGHRRLRQLESRGEHCAEPLVEICGRELGGGARDDDWNARSSAL